MNVVLNGEPTTLADGSTVKSALEALDLPGATTRGVAVAVDAEVVPRGQWDQTQLHEGARVEILRAIQGG
jgi:sulfur carrier protein